MIDRKQLLADCQDLVEMLVDDLRQRTDEVDEIRSFVRGEYARAESAGRTERAYEDWREDILAQVAVGWALAAVFVRFVEDNELIDTPLLSGPGQRRDLARDHRAAWLGDNPALGDREWLLEVFDRVSRLPGMGELLGDRNPVRMFGPSADGARAILELWWRQGDDGSLRHDFTDPEWDTRFLGDLYQDLSEHAKDTYALLQTPEFVEEFILDYTLDPAIDAFGLDQVRMIDPTCGSGHFLLGSFDRLVTLWQDCEPGTNATVLAQRALDAVNGVDINPFAAEIARFRLLVAAVKYADVKRLVDAPDFELNVAVGDSLIHGTAVQLTLDRDEADPLVRHRYPTENGQLADELLQPGRYHAVVGNPPYINVKDKALSDAYRDRYDACYRQYSLGVPFTQRFFRLATGADGGAGFVGMITANSFMKREFGRPLVEEYLASEVDLTHIVDTSGVYLPGHGTSTVVLFGRNRRPLGSELRVALGIRGEPNVPDDPGSAEVWTAILSQLEQPGSESEYLSVEDAPRSRFASHPWSLRGGAAPDVFKAVEGAASKRLHHAVRLIGYTAQTNADDAFVMEREAQLRRGIRPERLRPWIVGHLVRDWRIEPGAMVVFPYDRTGLMPLEELPDVRKALWPLRTSLWARRTFSKQSYREEGRPWWEWHQVALDRIGTPSVVFPNVATHAHFALDDEGAPTNSHAPFLKLHEDATIDDHLGLMGVLNCSTGLFWMKEVYYPKGGDRVGTEGARLSKSLWEDRYEFDGTKLEQFPLPDSMPLDRATKLHQLAQELESLRPHAVLGSTSTTREDLDVARGSFSTCRATMVSVQEELDWECYELYGLVEDRITSSEAPPLHVGERAFEIALARRVASGGTETSWFERHDSTPITVLPAHWPDDYRRLVEQRIELIESDRAIGLLERPEYKRRWNWDDWDELEEDALRSWLHNRLESEELWADGSLTSTARLAGRLQGDPAFMEVARLYAGDAELADVVRRLMLDQAVPYLAAYRYKKKGFTKRNIWENVWQLQREEDGIDARTKLPPDDPNHLTEEDAALLKKEKVGKIPVPPKFRTNDFASSTYWSLRGKLDVPKERFILFPDTRLGADTSPVIGWAGWDHLEQARALSGHYTQRKSEGAEPAELIPLLAGLHELVPWLLQWHNEPDPEYGERLGEFFESFVDTEARALGTTTEDLAAWRPS